MNIKILEKFQYQYKKLHQFWQCFQSKAHDCCLKNVYLTSNAESQFKMSNNFMQVDFKSVPNWLRKTLEINVKNQLK